MHSFRFTVADVFGGLCLAVLAMWSAAASTAAESTQPNIVFILVDDMGYGDPGCYNADSKIRTPNIDQIASAGMRFTDAHASGPLCHMSRYGLMTGRYPFRTNVNVWSKQPLIRSGETTLPSLLSAAGYSTAMVGKWHLGFAENGYENPLPGGPVDVGFDSFFGIRASTDIPPYFYIRDRSAVQPPTQDIAANASEGWSPIQGAFWRKGKIAPELELADVLPRFTDEAIDVIHKHAHESADSNDKPLFLYLAYPAPHTPWLPSTEFAGQSKVGMYGDFLEMTDFQIGRILNALEQENLAENTLLVFSSDNGPVWYDRDVEKFGHDSCGPLRGMKADAWEAGHRMPFIVRWPGVTKPNSESAQLVCFTDLLATAAEITGRKLSGDAAPDSFSFASVLTGASETSSRNSLVIQAGKGLKMIRDGSLKFINGPGSGGFSGRANTAKGVKKPEEKLQLYDLSNDLSESENLASNGPADVARMQKLLDKIVKASGHRFIK